MMCTPRSGRDILLAALLAVAPLTGGCQMIKAIAVQAAPKSENVPPEYNRLPGKTVLVHVWAPPEILWDYPKLRVDLSAYASGYLSKNIAKVTLIDPVRVETYIEQGNSQEIDPVELGRHFRADMVIHLAVYQFSLRDPGMAHFYRGRIGASVAVYDLTQQGAPADRTPLKDVMVSVPDEKEVGYPNVRPDQLRQATYDVFAVELGKKFHEWERPIG